MVVVVLALVIVPVAAAAAPVVAASSAPIAVTATASASVSATGGVVGNVAVTVMATGPAALAVLGAAEDDDGVTSWDCWKQVLRDEDQEPSRGKLLRDVVVDPRIKEVRRIDGHEDDPTLLPQIVLENVWGESFRIDYVQLPGSEVLAAHATRLEK